MGHDLAQARALIALAAPDAPDSAVLRDVAGGRSRGIGPDARLERVLELLAEIAGQQGRGDGVEAAEAAVADSAWRLGAGLVADGDLPADQIVVHVLDEIGDAGAPGDIVSLLSSVLDVMEVFAR